MYINDKDTIVNFDSDLNTEYFSIFIISAESTTLSMPVLLMEVMKQLLQTLAIRIIANYEFIQNGYRIKRRIFLHEQVNFKQCTNSSRK